MTTMDKILSLLRKETLTVTELVARLGVTRNAVIVPLRQLESRGLVSGKARSEGRVGKPALEYAAVPGREDESSSAYPAFASLLVETLHENLDAEQIQTLMDRVGQKMASHLDVKHLKSFSERLKSATEFADSLGADTLVDLNAEGAIVRSFSCPLGRSVRKDSSVCGVIAAFFSNVTGSKVEECCDRGQKLRCKFVIEKESQELPIT